MSRASLARSRERVGESQLDERLTGDAYSPGFAVDGLQHVNGEVHVDALNRAPRTAGLRHVQMRDEGFSSIVHLVETSRAQRLSRRGSALLPLDVHGGPR